MEGRLAVAVDDVVNGQANQSGDGLGQIGRRAPGVGAAVGLAVMARRCAGRDQLTGTSRASSGTVRKAHLHLACTTPVPGHMPAAVTGQDQAKEEIRP